MDIKGYAKAKGRSYSAAGSVGLDEKEWGRFLNLISVFGDAPRRGEILSIIRKSIKPVMLAAQKEAARIETGPNYRGVGNLYDSIGIITGRSRTFPNLQVGARVTKSFKGFHAWMVEHGTKRRSTANGWNRGASTANPFMRPAFEKTLASVKPAFERNIADYIQKKADKVFK